MRSLLILSLIALVFAGVYAASELEGPVEQAIKAGATHGVVFDDGRGIVLQRGEPFPWQLRNAGRARQSLVWISSLPLGACDDVDDCEVEMSQACKDAGHTGCLENTAELEHLENGDSVCSCDCHNGAVAFKICNKPKGIVNE